MVKQLVITLSQDAIDSLKKERKIYELCGAKPTFGMRLLGDLVLEAIDQEISHIEIDNLSRKD